MQGEQTTPVTAETAHAVVDGGDCPHPTDRRSYLGNMNTLAMYRCDGCGGVLLRFGSA